MVVISFRFCGQESELLSGRSAVVVTAIPTILAARATKLHPWDIIIPLTVEQGVSDGEVIRRLTDFSQASHNITVIVS